MVLPALFFYFQLLAHFLSFISFLLTSYSQSHKINVRGFVCLLRLFCSLLNSLETQEAKELYVIHLNHQGTVPCWLGRAVFGQTQHEVGCCLRISQETSPCDCQAPCRVTSPCPMVWQETCPVWTRCGPPGNGVGCWAPDAGRRDCRGLRTNAWRCALCRWEGLAYWDYCRTHSTEQRLTTLSHNSFKKQQADLKFSQQMALLVCLIRTQSERFLPVSLNWTDSSTINVFVGVEVFLIHLHLYHINSVLFLSSAAFFFFAVVQTKKRS